MGNAKDAAGYLSESADVVAGVGLARTQTARRQFEGSLAEGTVTGLQPLAEPGLDQTQPMAIYFDRDGNIHVDRRAPRPERSTLEVDRQIMRRAGVASVLFVEEVSRLGGSVRIADGQVVVDLDSVPAEKLEAAHLLIGKWEAGELGQ